MAADEDDNGHDEERCSRDEREYVYVDFLHAHKRAVVAHVAVSLSGSVHVAGSVHERAATEDEGEDDDETAHSYWVHLAYSYSHDDDLPSVVAHVHDVGATRDQESSCAGSEPVGWRSGAC